jgi:hypothetical protein
MFEKISCQANWAESGAVGQARLQNQNKRFLVILSNQVFSSEKVAFFRKKLLIPLRNVEFRDEHFGSFGKILNFSVRE